MAASNILVVRLGSLGDVIHTLPAVSTLKHSFPRATLCWAIDPRWAPLLEGNPFIDRVILLGCRSTRSVLEAWRQMRKIRFELAVDFQGLIKSALVASLARPDRLFGFHQSQVREKFSALFYSNKCRTAATHKVDQNLELAAAAGASSILRTFPVPEGSPEGELPEGEFVLANPLAGWGSKQWPLKFYRAVARRLRDELGIAMVLNGPPASAPLLGEMPEAQTHFSGIAGLIHATRRAIAVLGIDSGPLHLAAALGKPGVAIYGPTDPARNGPYSESITVLRSPRAVTTYKRRSETDPSMDDISPDAVFEALRARIALQRKAAISSL